MSEGFSIKIDEAETKIVLQEIDTNGYLLLYLEGDRVKIVGNMSIKSLAPILLKLAAERVS